MAHSVLSQVGLQQLSARDEDEFVSIAVAVARDTDRLTELRAMMRERMRASPLMDAARFVIDLEELYRGIWETRRAALAR
jgi:predicted O-linked N-acetylglucosamine transferase (SPINDLY family)